MSRKDWMRVGVVIMVVVVLFSFLYVHKALAQGDDDTGDSDKGKGHKKSVLDLFMATMPVGALLLIICIAGVAFSIQYNSIIKEEVILPPSLQSQLDQALSLPQTGQGGGVPQLEFDETGVPVNIQDAINICDAAGDRYLAKIVSAGLVHSDEGHEEMVRAMDEAANIETFNLNVKISVLNLIGNLGPLTGLLGTVTGMISSFQKIEGMKAPTPSDLATGIYEALVNTTMGLFIAITFLSIYFFYKNNLNKRTLKANTVASELLSKANILLEVAKQQSPSV